MASRRVSTRLRTHPRRRSRQLPVLPVDRARLERDLRDGIRGRVAFDRGERALFATDASNYRQIPLGVVYPRDEDDVLRTIALAHAYGAPLLPRGGGTSLAGQGTNTAVVLDFTRHMQRVLEVDPHRRIGRVQAGTYLDQLRDAVAPHGLTFGPDPATHTHCAIGGMIGNNSCGIHSMLAEFRGPGPTTDANIIELDVVTRDGTRLRVGRTSDEELDAIIHEGGRRGEIYLKLRRLRDRYAGVIRERFPKLLRRVSGYNLPALLPENGFDVARALVGSEGTCVTVLAATCRLIENPPCRAMLVIGYDDVCTAADHVPRVRKFRPVGLEGMDRLLVDFMEKKGLHTKHIGLLPAGDGWLIAEFGGDSPEDARQQAADARDALCTEDVVLDTKIYDDPLTQEHLWTVRESGLGATAFIPGERPTWEGWEDAAVPVDRLGDYIREFRALLREFDYDASLYGHFGQGLIHTRIPFDLVTADGIDRFAAFTDAAADLVVRYGGSLSGEHGDGQARGDLIEKMYGPEIMQAFREFRAIWDPEGLMNPGKLVDPMPRTANLRLGSDYRPATPKTFFRFPDDQGSIAHATLRCVGVGKCRRHEHGTMCPSYMVLREEKHTTRGRARILFEMLQGEVIEEGWQSEEVHESLDLCLSCKGCKGECPVNVDIPTLKAEFLAHHWAGRLRPRHAYAFGLIDLWARLGSRVPRLVNALGHAPITGRIAKAVAGIAPQRTIPRFASRTFRRSFEERPRNGRPRVILWPDTFNDHFFPEVLDAGRAVLEYAGFHVTLPERHLCCGRPLYEYGMLRRARRLLRRTMDTLRDDIAAGTPLVALEPGCLSVLRDELVSLFPHDQDARRLARQSLTLAEFLDKHAPDLELPEPHGRTLVHGHCHHKAILDFDADMRVLDRMDADHDVLDSGCCGMAGAFGFEKHKYDLSIAVGERVLLPAVRDADADTHILTDGFSCREQILQQTGRRPLHLAELIQRSIHRPARRVSRTPATERHECIHA